MNQFDCVNCVQVESYHHPNKSQKADLIKIIEQLQLSKVTTIIRERHHKSYPDFLCNMMAALDS